MSKCYQCANADFKTPAQKQMAGFCHCKAKKESWSYLPSCNTCDIGKFTQADEKTMERRRVFFNSLGKVGLDDVA